MPFEGNLEAIEVAQELGRRRVLVAEGKSRILNEEEALGALKAAGCHV